MTGLWLAGAAAAQQIEAARYEGATDRYPHAVLGDALEWHTLVVRLSDGRSLKARYERPVVFEDLEPRLFDMDADGQPEVMVIESHETQGARLAFWGLVDGALAPLATTPWIGTRFRWLAPLGAADLDGDGVMEFAYVDRPHLAKTLRVWRYVPDGAGKVRLEPVASQAGFSNHRIGWDYIEGGIRDCGRGPEMVLASGNWRSVQIVRWDGMDLRSEAVSDYSATAISKALACG
ncbi:FG-GAP repeat domain-containing protein [Thalassococcus lentus]|uniref:VCBS repeat-containing protein n=1 Tax=Thalassococcus lentus TaxID=1210524 RepID=A0ABT4XSD3_9RHOB|nr:VCBS repeat-containing protein [Thalassococcus lentus]MDA7424860.1 VCBS repeat-containing protein [Thalassococcus lentus]